MSLFECPGTTIFQVIMKLQLKVRVSMALDGLDVIV